MVTFRNLAVSPEAPVAEWGVEGLLAAIDRGGLREWRRIVDAVRDDPGGDVAADLEQALALAEDRGVVAAMGRSLARLRMPEAALHGRRVRSWVENSGMSRAELARLVGTSRSRLSTYEGGTVVPAATTAEKLRRPSVRRREHLV